MTRLDCFGAFAEDALAHFAQLGAELGAEFFELGALGFLPDAALAGYVAVVDGVLGAVVQEIA